MPLPQRGFESPRWAASSRLNSGCIWTHVDTAHLTRAETPRKKGHAPSTTTLRSRRSAASQWALR
eukprot:10672779-Alexandrium_andersonii.AAC.1